MPTIGTRLRSAWNAFTGRDPTESMNIGSGTYYPAYKSRMLVTNTRSIVAGIYNRISVDVSQLAFREVIVDENDKFKQHVKSGLNDCLKLNANVDQTGRSLIQDIVLSLFDEGAVAIVPTDTSINPYVTDSFEIESLRVGKITEWYPLHVKVNVYNERTGRKEDVLLPKDFVAIIENPFYSIMNEPNSTLQRLIRALNDLDVSNRQNNSGKLDLIISFPYSTRNPLQKERADTRRAEIENQLIGSKYGIAYTDGTEHITQLNRAIENNIWEQVVKLTEQLYNQLGLTTAIFDGTADEATMLNYNNRTIEPIATAITDAFSKSFLTKTARTRGHAVKFFNEPFRLVPVNSLAEIADKFTRNEIMSSNEFRAVIGFKPVDDERANELRNKNLNASDEQLQNPVTTDDELSKSIIEQEGEENTIDEQV